MILELSGRTKYALMAMLEMASIYDTGETLQIRQIAAAQDIPDRYLEQLLATLRRGGLISSERGKKGGYLLARSPQKITLLEIVNCMEGGEASSSETSDDSEAVSVQAISQVWQNVKRAADDVLGKNSLQDLLEKRNYLQNPMAMYYI
ncbi:MAG: Rrf2 family transcriptional regulator [Plectolyngbya sp. WJT66-NPBG17]|jgi:Rrf2 family protein|nr:Rrf2 family transcriptional regulator [Plectolyngbya sp. WJT66-NPBG17]MBW4528737.1 Rrf2 family transcriptional regulator [Phormidium tanganyikae FI6-MK23]